MMQAQSSAAQLRGASGSRALAARRPLAAASGRHSLSCTAAAVVTPKKILMMGALR